MSETAKQTSHYPNMSLFTVQLIERLKDGTPGDTITDEELRGVCGKDCAPNGDGYSYLQSAVRYCTKNYKVVWRRIREGAAIECLNWEGVSNLADSRLKHVRRTSRQAVNELKTIDVDQVPIDRRPLLNVTAAQLGMLASMASSGTQKKLQTRNIQSPVDVSKLIESMK